MSRIKVTAGSVDVSVTIQMKNTDGTNATGKTSADLGLSYRRENTINIQQVVDSDLAFVTSAHADGGIIEVLNGAYRVDIPDAVCAIDVVTAEVYLSGGGMQQVGGPLIIDMGDTNVSAQSIQKIVAAIKAGDEFLPNKNQVWQLIRTTEDGVVVRDAKVVSKQASEKLFCYANFESLLGKGEEVSEIVSITKAGGSMSIVAGSQSIKGRYVLAEFTGGGTGEESNITMTIRTTRPQDMVAEMKLQIK